MIPTQNRTSLYQLILALASLGALVYLGTAEVLSGDAVAGMIGAIVAYVTGQQAHQFQSSGPQNGVHVKAATPITVETTPPTTQPPEERMAA